MTGASTTPKWFDAHLDLACLALNRREMTAPLARVRGEAALAGPWPPASVTLPSLREGGVRWALATVFTGADLDHDAVGYRSGDVIGARRAGEAQVETYRHWADRGLIGIAQHAEFSRVFRDETDDRLRIGILVEGADPISTPDELGWWRDQGVVAIGLTWARGTRYASGNATPHEDDIGLTSLGREMVDAMDTLGVVHDVSHLSLRAMDAVLERARGRVMASHSNCRALLGGEEGKNAARHIDDDTIREIARRGGVIGLNLCRNFIRAGLKGAERPSIAEAIDHVEHICELTGSCQHVGLGSDMDGGFSANDLPEDIDAPADLVKLCDELVRRGWSANDVRRFVHGNWLRFWETNGEQS